MSRQHVIDCGVSRLDRNLRSEKTLLLLPVRQLQHGLLKFKVCLACAIIMLISGYNSIDMFIYIKRRDSKNCRQTILLLSIKTRD